MVHGGGLAANPSPSNKNAGSIDFEVTEPAGMKLVDPNVGGAGGPGGIRYAEMAKKYSFAKLEQAGTSTLPATIPATAPRLRYQVKFNPASYQAGTSSGALNFVDTPILQEVTLTYFLPSPLTLLKERVVD